MCRLVRPVAGLIFFSTAWRGVMSAEHDSGHEEAPRGTWVLLCLVALGMTAAWLFLYFGVFLPRGQVG